MGTTADKLNKLLETKAAIKAAIVEKGQSVTDEDTFASYEAKIRAIRTSDIRLAEIAITKQPTKTSYTAKESFNPAGMEVKAVFSNDAAKFVDDFTVEPSGALKPTDTKATVKYTEFGVTAEADVAITVAAIQLSVPAASGTPVYTGSAITPAWTGYDSSLMDISGDTSGTNAGSYTAKFSLKDKVNYTWADGTTADKSVAWSIGKAQASITLDKTSVVLNGDKLSETVVISSVGMASIMAMSSDPSVATVALAGNVLTINSVNETTGEATIALSGEVDSNYNAPEYPSVEVSAEFVKLSSIAVTTPPAKTEYKEGEVFDPAGMVVTATYSNGVQKVITNYTIINGDQISEDMNTVMIYYTENGVTATTQYEVSFVLPLTVTMTQANPSGVTAYISWDGGSASEPGTYQVPAGTEMRAYISHKGNLTDMLPYIIFNGTSVGTSGSEGSYYDPTYFADYTFTLTKDITFYVGTYGKGAYAIYINEV